MKIDGGNPNGLALAYPRSIGVTHLNVVIVTHLHSGASNTTSIFERFIDPLRKSLRGNF